MQKPEEFTELELEMARLWEMRQDLQQLSTLADVAYIEAFAKVMRVRNVIRFSTGTTLVDVPDRKVQIR